MLWLSSLIPELDCEYLWLCDDFILLRPLEIDVARQNRYLGDMSETTNRGKGLWKDSLWRTYDLLTRLGYPGYNFETHTPTYFTKRRVFDAYRGFRDFVTEDRWHGMLGQTAVLNHAMRHENSFPLMQIVEGRERAGFYNEGCDYETIVERCRTPLFLNFDDKAFNDAMRRYLSERFPTPCIYERRVHERVDSGRRSVATGEDGETTTTEPHATNATRPEPECRQGTILRFPPVIMKDRGQMGEFLNSQGLCGEGVEVGVASGVFSERLLKTWKGRRLHCVDPWSAVDDDPNYIDRLNVSQETHDRNHAEAVRRLSAFADRYAIHRVASREAAATFADGSLDFVYLDARHYAAAVREDIELWAPKIRGGGFLAGHDYLDGILPSGHFQVKSTVDQWAGRHGLHVACSGEHVWRSWFVKLP
ncbi:MAG: class I SAM-dependent methyltransferase [Planctomycetales bacterium]|nr:class I SAM-dependent methyltransferase [Planctomycetales bacterium]